MILGIAMAVAGGVGAFLPDRGKSPAFVLLILLGLSVASAAAGLGRVKIGGLNLDYQADQTRARIDAGGPVVRVEGQTGGTINVEFPEGHDEATVRASESLRRQEAILEEIYTQGLAQARVSFRVSIFFGSIGAIFLLGGVGLAIARAGSDGERYASVVAAVSGTVIELTSGVFFLQSNRARKNMGDQGVLLREESQEDRRLTAARELSAAIEQPALRDQVRADIARTLVRSRPKDNGEAANSDIPVDDGAEQSNGRHA